MKPLNLLYPLQSKVLKDVYTVFTLYIHLFVFVSVSDYKNFVIVDIQLMFYF